MVIGPDYVFVAVPRTASISIGCYWLPEHYGGVKAQGVHHRRSVPFDAAGKMIWAVVRDPYARMASLWNLYKRRGRHKDFTTWLRWCLGGDADEVTRCQSTFLAGVEADVDHLIKFETLEEHLARLPFVRRGGFHLLPVKNTREQPEGRRKPQVAEHPEKHLTREQVAMINEHSHEDFEVYRYEKY